MPPSDQRPRTSDDWVGIANRELENLRKAYVGRQTNDTKIDHALKATEAALKAVIWKANGWSAWPRGEKWRHLYQHDLHEMLKELPAAVLFPLRRSGKHWASWRVLANTSLKQARYSPTQPTDDQANEIARSARHWSGPMATRSLSQEQLALGRAVLLATDAFGMSAEGAFWLHDRQDDKWRYFLVSSLFGRVRARQLYLRLDDALAKTLSKREAQDFELYVASPNERLVKEVRRSARTDRYTSEPIHHPVGMNGKSAQAWVYRLASGLDEATARSAQRRFLRRTKALIAA